MKRTTVWTTLLLALGGAAAAADLATAHHFVVDGPFKAAIGDATVAAAGTWYQELQFKTETVSLHFQNVALDEGETILVAGANPDQTVSYDAAAGADFWTPVFEGGRIEIAIQNRDGGRTSVLVPEVVLGFTTMESLDAQRAKVDSYHRVQLGDPEATGSNGTNKIIYGADDRKEPHQVTDVGLLNVAKSTCAVVFRSEVTNNGNGTYTLHTTPYNSVSGEDLCTSEPFYNQRSIGFCTGFLVAPTILTTAGHCVDADNRASVAFVFDFKMQSNGGQPLTTVSADNVYFATSIRNQILIGNSDHSVLNLDRAVVSRDPLTIRRSGTIPNGTALTLVGHPATIPLKIAGGAVVKNNRSGVPYFDANTDSYGGNSGSPVVNSETYVVEGILVRGQQDYVLQGNCAVSNRVSDNADNGWEQITKSTEWDQFVPTPTGTPTATPTPAGSPTATFTPTISPTPTVSPTPSISPTASPTPTPSPIPTPSPTPKPEVLFEFAASTDNWTNASVAGFVAPNFSQGEGRLVISTADNQNTFGYWQHSNLRITVDGTGAGTDTAIIGTTGPDSLYRATYRLSTNVANVLLAPTVRLRASAGNNEQTTELMVSSVTGTYSVSPQETNFVQFFSQPINQTRVRLAVDVLNVGGVDAISCDVRVQSVLLEAMTKSALSGEVKELDRPLANDTEWTFSNAGGGYLPPVFERTAEGPSVKGTSDVPPAGLVIGYWSSARGHDQVFLSTGRIYRADFTLATTAPATLRSTLPTIRLRVNDSSFNTAVLTNIESVNGTVVLPSSDGGPVVRSVYYVAPAALDQNYLRYSLDYIWSPLLDNDPAIPIVLRKLEVYSYDPLP